jgi:hypothetical protein
VKDPQSDRPQVQITYQKQQKKIFCWRNFCNGLTKIKANSNRFLRKRS